MKKLMPVVLVTVFAVASLAIAGPRAQDWKLQRSLTSQEDFQSLKSGDKIAMTCKPCGSTSTLEIKSKEDATALCKEGSTLSCPACKQKATAKVSGPRPENPHRQVRYVDQQGKSCMVMTQLQGKVADGGSMHRGPDTPHRSHK